MSGRVEPRRCACGALVPGSSGWAVCLPCRRDRRQAREAAELEAAHHRAALDDLARSVDGRTWNALRLGPRP